MRSHETRKMSQLQSEDLPSPARHAARLRWVERPLPAHRCSLRIGSAGCGWGLIPGVLLVHKHILSHRIKGSLALKTPLIIPRLFLAWTSPAYQLSSRGGAPPRLPEVVGRRTQAPCWSVFVSEFSASHVGSLALLTEDSHTYSLRLLQLLFLLSEDT